MKKTGRPVVFTSAVGDMLHTGHLRLFQKASKLGDLVVGIPTSASNVKIKGRETVISLEDRLLMIQALKCVRLCIAYEGKEELDDLIQLIHPDYVCRGDDQKDFNGKAAAEAVGAKIVYFPYSKDISSTKIRERIEELWK